MFQEINEKIKTLIDSEYKEHHELAYHLLVSIGYNEFDAHILVYKFVDFNKSDKLVLSAYSCDDIEILKLLPNSHKVTNFDDRAMINYMAFTINDWTFYTYTDPDDGYRSYNSGTLILGKVKLKNQFPPVEVSLKVNDSTTGNRESTNTFSIKNYNSDKPLLKYGTDYHDGWYPCSISFFNVVLLNQYLNEL